MLASTNRLPAKEIDIVKRDGKLFQRKFFGICVINRSDISPSRFGFVVSTKISKFATIRNRIKRALRESVRYSLVNLNPGYDVVFLAKTVLTKVSTDEIMQEVQLSLRDLGIMR